MLVIMQNGIETSKVSTHSIFSSHSAHPYRLITDIYILSQKGNEEKKTMHFTLKIKNIKWIWIGWDLLNGCDRNTVKHWNTKLRIRLYISQLTFCQRTLHHLPCLSYQMLSSWTQHIWPPIKKNDKAGQICQAYQQGWIPLVTNAPTDTFRFSLSEFYFNSLTE